MEERVLEEMLPAGWVDPAFAAVGEAFRANFRPGDGDPGDLGATLCVIADGRVVVDCWGGWRDLEARRPWERDTLVNAYSVLKPVAAVLALDSVATAVLGLDEPLATAWPEFATGGKEGVTLRQVLSHRAALPAIREHLADRVIGEWTTLCDALARCEPWWEPGTAHGYHVNTFGFLAGEPVCRAEGKRFGMVLRERITGPLDLDLHVGLGTAECERAADVDLVALPAPPEPPAAGGPEPVRNLGEAEDEMARMRLSAYFNPPGFSGIGIVNTSAWRQAVVPSTNGHATARAVAGFYAALLPGVSRPILPGSLIAEATETHSEGHDLVLDRPTRFGLGFALHLDARPVGITTSSFGHYGHGGSLGFAAPDAGIAFAYLVNRPGDRWQNPRTRRLLDTLRSCL